MRFDHWSDAELVALLEQGTALGPSAGGAPVLLDVEGVPVCSPSACR